MRFESFDPTVPPPGRMLKPMKKGLKRLMTPPPGQFAAAAPRRASAHNKALGNVMFALSQQTAQSPPAPRSGGEDAGVAETARRRVSSLRRVRAQRLLVKDPWRASAAAAPSTSALPPGGPPPPGAPPGGHNWTARPPPGGAPAAEAAAALAQQRAAAAQRAAPPFAGQHAPPLPPAREPCLGSKKSQRWAAVTKSAGWVEVDPEAEAGVSYTWSPPSQTGGVLSASAARRAAKKKEKKLYAEAMAALKKKEADARTSVAAPPRATKRKKSRAKTRAKQPYLGTKKSQIWAMASGGGGGIEFEIDDGDDSASAARAAMVVAQGKSMFRNARQGNFAMPSASVSSSGVAPDDARAGATYTL